MLVVVVFNAAGYAQGKMVCVQADDGNMALSQVVLLRQTDLNAWKNFGPALFTPLKVRP